METEQLDTQGVVQDFNFIGDTRQGAAAARRAMVADRQLLIGWLDTSFPYTYGPERNEPCMPPAVQTGETTLEIMASSALPATELWFTESVHKAITALNGGERMQLVGVEHNSGSDWLTPGNFGRQFYAVIDDIPRNLREYAGRIERATRCKIKGGLAMQSFSGAVVEMSGVTCQLGRTSETFGFETLGNRHIADRHFVRAWRTA